MPKDFRLVQYALETVEKLRQLDLTFANLTAFNPEHAACRPPIGIRSHTNMPAPNKVSEAAAKPKKSGAAATRQARVALDRFAQAIADRKSMMLGYERTTLADDIRNTEMSVAAAVRAMRAFRVSPAHKEEVKRWILFLRILCRRMIVLLWCFRGEQKTLDGLKGERGALAVGSGGKVNESSFIGGRSVEDNGKGDNPVLPRGKEKGFESTTGTKRGYLVFKEEQPVSVMKEN